MTRTEFPRKVKVAAFERAKGACEGCGARLTPGKFDYDHRLPVALGGKSEIDNCQCLCSACHSGKSGSQDVPRIRKADRQRSKYLGAKTRKSRPMMGTKASGWKHKLGGGWERRQ